MEFKNNLPFTLYSNNDTLGQPLDTNKFVNGTGILNIYYGQEKIRSSFTYKNQVANGPYICYDAKGNITEHGVLIGDNDSVYSHIKKYNDQDINLYAVWQMRFLNGSKSMFYNEEGAINGIGISYFDDTLHTDVIEYSFFNEDSVLISKYKYAYRLKTGLEINYYNDGEIKSLENHFIANKNDSIGSYFNGTCYYYNNFGKIRAQVNYYLGEEIDKSYFYDNNSKLIRTKVIEENGISYSIFKGDTVNYTDFNGLKQGKWIYLDFGLHTNMQVSDLPTEIKYFKNSKPCGTWTYYSNNNMLFKNRKISKEIIWKNDSIGYCKDWFSNGKISEEGFIINIDNEGYYFLRDGMWKIYNFRNGKLELKGNYCTGYKVGIWHKLNKKGKVISESDYKDGIEKNYW